MDKNELASAQYITEYPILTALARNQGASLNLIKKFKTYIAGKNLANFPYLRKTYLIYSSLVKSYCQNNACSQQLLVRMKEPLEYGKFYFLSNQSEFKQQQKQKKMNVRSE